VGILSRDEVGRARLAQPQGHLRGKRIVMKVALEREIGLAIIGKPLKAQGVCFGVELPKKVDR
jgi:hypothetical protein